MKSHASEKIRHVVLRGEVGDVLPDSLSKALFEREVACGWLRANAVLIEVEVRAFDTERGAPATIRRIAGPVQAVAIEGSVGLARGEVTVGLHAVLARETDRGMETLAGEIVTAKVIALEAVVTAFDDLALARAIDSTANVWMFADTSSTPPRADAPAPAPAPAAKASSPAIWSEAIAASVDAEPPRAPAPRPVSPNLGTTGTGGAVIPPRIVRPVSQEDPQVIPDAGDAVEHFAFGTADVIKSDGERLHLRVHKDQRIREIALEMLKVTPLASDGPTRKFRLDRKL